MIAEYSKNDALREAEEKLGVVTNADSEDLKAQLSTFTYINQKRKVYTQVLCGQILIATGKGNSKKSSLQSAINRSRKVL